MYIYICICIYIQNTDTHIHHPTYSVQKKPPENRKLHKREKKTINEHPQRSVTFSKVKHNRKRRIVLKITHLCRRPSL